MADSIAREIKQVSGFTSAADLKAAMPDDPDVLTGEPVKPKRGRKPGAPSPRKTVPQPVSDPFLNDKRYQEACGEMAAFGGKGLIERGFDAGAKLLEDEKFKLDAKEHRTWDNFFYVLSKKPMFDVGSPVFLALFFIITLAAQLGWRVFERSDSEFILNLFHPKPVEPEVTPQ